MGTGIILGLIVVLIVIAFGMYNSFIKLKNKVEEAFATMDVYLKKRYDLIPNLVETVKGYAKHEKDTLQSVIDSRNTAMGSKTIDEKVQNENALQGTLKSLFALAEAYPDLKANASFLDLQGQLQKIETDIAQARKYYNAVVRQFNTKCEIFPHVIIAKLFGFTKKPMFEIDNTERENVSVKF